MPCLFPLDRTANRTTGLPKVGSFVVRFFLLSMLWRTNDLFQFGIAFFTIRVIMYSDIMSIYTLSAGGCTVESL